MLGSKTPMLSPEEIRRIEQKVVQGLSDSSGAVRYEAAQAAALFPASIPVRDALIGSLEASAFPVSSSVLCALIPHLFDDEIRARILAAPSFMAAGWVEQNLLYGTKIEVFIRALGSHTYDPRVRQMLCRWVDAAALGNPTTCAKGVLIVELLARSTLHVDVRDHWFNFSAPESAEPIISAMLDALKTKLVGGDRGLTDYLRAQVRLADKPERRVLAVSLLKHATSVPAVCVTLAQATSDPEPQVASAAIGALANLVGTNEAVYRSVVEAACSGPVGVQVAAVTALGPWLNLSGAYEAVIAATSSDFWPLREAAMKSLAVGLMEDSAQKSIAERKEPSRD